MKVLLCSPFEGHIGGIVKWTKGIVDYYKESSQNSSVELEVYSLSRKRAVYSNDNFFTRFFYGVKEYIPLLINFKKKLFSTNYDIVHISSSGSFGLLRDLFLLHLSKKSKIKTVIHFHFGRIPVIFGNNNWEKYLLEKVLKLANKVIVMDNNSFEALHNYGFANVIYLPNPLNSNAEEIIAINYNKTQRKARTIVFVGHMVATKGVFELIEACKQIDDVQVDFIGYVSRDTREKLKKAIGNDFSRIKIHGEKEYSDTIKHMLATEIFVLPSYSEGFPNVILESMACGCAIIATNVGAIPEILNVKNEGLSCGICVETHNALQLKNAIENMLNDNQFALNCKTNALKRVSESYSISFVWPEIVKIWHSV
ncbi:glycosyltransferase family 4 protein [Flavobacterium sp. PL12]|uniref:glycosyltransferase family 4 protein n=1 Tax=Flavobacterium sp. PL12 TaxID=3071718 RepID=UPI00319DDAB4